MSKIENRNAVSMRCARRRRNAREAAVRFVVRTPACCIDAVLGAVAPSCARALDGALGDATMRVKKNRRADVCSSGPIRQVTWRNSHQEVRGPPVPNRRRLASRNALPLLLGRLLRGLLRNLLGLLSCLSHCRPSLESVRISPDKKIMSKRARLVDY